MQQTLIDKFLFIVPTTISDHFDEIKQLKNISIEKTIETSILNFFERNKCTVSRDSMVHICTLLTRHDWCKIEDKSGNVHICREDKSRLLHIHRKKLVFLLYIVGYY